jgi:predicted metal-binding membrane protein
MSDVSTIERLLKRDRVIVLAALSAMAGLSAVYTVLGVGMDMSALDMTAMPGDMLMAAAIWTPEYALLAFFMWWIMMIAMMLPSAAPVLLLYAALKRRRREIVNPVAMTAAFLSGNLAVWVLFSLLATSLQWILQFVGLVSGMLNVSNKALGITILLAASVYQFSPLKQVCLKQCRQPARFIAGPQGTGLTGALRLGGRHGTYCVGCCGGLMLLLFFGGIMNLFWIAGLGVYVLLEKLLPQGRWLSYAAGIGLFAVGVKLMASLIITE